MAQSQVEIKSTVLLANDLEKRVADAFSVFDHAATEAIDSREVGTILRGLGCCPTEREIQEVTVKVEDNHNVGTVELLKFITVVCQELAEHKYEPATPEQLLEAFQILDTEGRGYLTKEQLISYMTTDGEPFNQDELDEMLELAIDPHTQTIPYEYYINQIMFEPEDEEDIYILADRIESERPPPPAAAKKISELFANVLPPE